MNHRATRNPSAAVLHLLVVSVEPHHHPLQAAQIYHLPKPLEPALMELGLVLAADFRGAVEGFAEGAEAEFLAHTLRVLFEGQLHPPAARMLLDAAIDALSAEGLGDAGMPPSLLALARWGSVVPPKHTFHAPCYAPDQWGSQAA